MMICAEANAHRAEHVKAKHLHALAQGFPGPAWLNCSYLPSPIGFFPWAISFWPGRRLQRFVATDSARIMNTSTR
jgi:hypothetical protein